MLRLLLRRELQASSLPLPFLSPPTTPLLRFLSSSSSADAKSALVTAALRSHGVPGDLCEALLPKLRGMRVEKNLGPKLAFLRSEGFSGAELADILLRNPSLLRQSLERGLAPSVAALRSFLPSKDALLRFLKHSTWLPAAKLQANIEFLKDHGLPEATIQKLALYNPRALSRAPDDFARALEFLEKLDLSPTGSAFAVALGTLSYMSRSRFRRNLEVYRELGWTEEEVLTMFKRKPSTLTISEDAIRKKAGFLRDVLGWGPEFLCRYPEIMAMNLDKRIVRRCAVLNVLASHWLVRWSSAVSPNKFLVSEARFVKNYVKKYDMSLDVVWAYEGKTEFTGWGRWKEHAKNQAPKLAA